MLLLNSEKSKLFHIKVKTPTTTNVVTAICPSSDHAWDMAWHIAGSSHASISVQVAK